MEVRLTADLCPTRSLGIVTEKMIDEWEAMLRNPRDQFIIRAIFEGISGNHFEDLISLKTSAIDPGHHTIEISDTRMINVSDHLCDLAMQAASTSTYHGADRDWKLSGDIEDVIKFAEDIKPKDALGKEREINSFLSRFFNHIAACGLSVEAITVGGKIHFINTRCKDLGITAPKYLDEHIEDLNTQYGDHTIKMTFLKAYGDFLHMPDNATKNVEVSVPERFFDIAFIKQDNDFVYNDAGEKIKWEKARLPEYSTKHSAGADFFCAEEVTIPSIWKLGAQCVVSQTPIKPTMVHTGIKAKMPEDEVLYIMNRSGGPKKGLVLANSIGVIDADYYGCEATDGEVMFAFYNFLPFDITIKVGDKIGQGVFHKMLRATNAPVSDATRIGGFNSTGNTN